MRFPEDQLASLSTLLAAPDTPADVATRARIVLLRAQGHTRGYVAEQTGVSLPTVDRWVNRFADSGIAGLTSRTHARAQVPEHVRRRVLELATAAPPTETGLSRWTTRALADYLHRNSDITVSSNYIATVLRETGVRLTDPSQAKRRRGRQPEHLDVHFEFVALDEPRASTLRQPQTTAIRDILQWLRDHPEGPGNDGEKFDRPPE